jgi:hypothetical protein
MPKFGADLDLQNNHLVRSRLENISDPQDKTPGRVWFDPILGRMVFGNAAGDGGIDPTDRTHHQGTQLAVTISDLHASVRTNNRLDQFAKPTAPVDVDGQKVINVPDLDFSDPSSIDWTQAINAGDLREQILSASLYKYAARLVATSNVDLTDPLPVIDGVQVLDNWNVLLTSQTTPEENGLYRAAAGGAASNRARGTIYIGIAEESPSKPTPVIGDIFSIDHVANTGETVYPPRTYVVTEILGSPNGEHSYELAVEATGDGADYERRVNYGTPATWVGHEDVVYSGGVGSIDVFGIWIGAEPSTGLIEFSLTGEWTFGQGLGISLLGTTINPWTNTYERQLQVTEVVEATAPSGGSTDWHYVLRVSANYRGVEYSLPSDTETHLDPVSIDPALAALFYNPADPTVNVYNDNGIDGIATPTVAGGAWVRTDSVGEELRAGEIVYIEMGDTRGEQLWYCASKTGVIETWVQIPTATDSIAAFAPPEIAINFNNQEVTGIADFNGDLSAAVNYGSLNTNLAGILFKVAVDYAATSPIDPTLIENGDTVNIDGGEVGYNFVLLTAQADAGQNGVYWVDGDGNWISYQNSTGFEINLGEAIFVKNGTLNKGKTFQRVDWAKYDLVNAAAFDQVLYKRSVLAVITENVDVNATETPLEDIGEGQQGHQDWDDYLRYRYQLNGEERDPDVAYFLLTGQNSADPGNGVYTLTKTADPEHRVWAKVPGRVLSGSTVYVRDGVERNQTWRCESTKTDGTGMIWEHQYWARMAPRQLYETVVHAVATTPIAMLDGTTFSIDGVPVTGSADFGERPRIVLLTAQADPSLNGLWLTSVGTGGGEGGAFVPGGSWNRITVGGQGVTRPYGMTVFALLGDRNGGTLWTLKPGEGNTLNGATDGGDPQYWTRPQAETKEHTAARVVTENVLVDGTGTWGDFSVSPGTVILLTGQTLPVENGLWFANPAVNNTDVTDAIPAAPWTRVDPGRHLAGGTTVYITEPGQPGYQTRWTLDEDVIVGDDQEGGQTWRNRDAEARRGVLYKTAVDYVLDYGNINIELDFYAPLVADNLVDPTGLVLLATQTDPAENGIYRWTFVDAGEGSSYHNLVRVPEYIDLPIGEVIYIKGGIETPGTCWVQQAPSNLPQIWGLLNYDIFVQRVQEVSLTDFGVASDDLDMGGNKIVNLADGVADDDAVNYGQLEGVRASLAAQRLDQVPAPTAPVSLSNQRITDLANPTADGDAVNRATLNAAIANVQAGVTDATLSDFGAPTEDLSIGGQKLIEVAAGTANTDGVNVGQMNTALATNSTDDRAFATSAIATQSGLDRAYTDDAVADSATTERGITNTALATNSTGDRAFATSAIATQSGLDRTYTDDAIADSATAERATTNTALATNSTDDRAYADAQDDIHSTADRAYADSAVATQSGLDRAYTDTAVAGIADNSLSDFAAPTGNLSMGGFALTNVLWIPNNPTAAVPNSRLTSALASNSTADQAFATAAIATQSGLDRAYTDTAVAGIADNSLSDFAVPTADLSLNAHKIVNLANGTANTDAVTLQQLNAATTNLASVTLDEVPAPAANVDFAGFRITGLGASQNASDAVTRAELDNVKNRTDWRPSVRVKTTGNITLSGLQTVDTVVLTENDRALVDQQTDGTTNGIYLVKTGAWVRAEDILSSETSTMVEDGTFKGTQWRIYNTDPVNIGTDAINWTQFGAAVIYTGSGGITKVGNDFRLDANVPRKYEALVGDGVMTEIPVAHGLGTRSLVPSVFYEADGVEVECNIQRTSVNVVTLGFAVAPAANELHVVFIG